LGGDLRDGGGERVLSSLLLEVSHGLGLVVEESERVSLLLLSGSLTKVSSEEVLVLLVGVVDVIVSVVVSVVLGVVSVILPVRVGLKVARLSVSPGLKLKISDGSSLVVRADAHGSSVGLVIDDFSSGVMLLHLSESLKNVIRADLHDVDLLLEAVSSSSLGGAFLEVADLSLATSGNKVSSDRHVLAVSSGGVTEATIFVSKSLVLSIRVPVVMSLVVSVSLVVGEIEITPYPGELRNETEIVRHLSELVRLEVVVLSDRVELLVDVRMDNSVSEVVMPLLLIIFREV
jgi:hypothetical protein